MELISISLEESLFPSQSAVTDAGLGLYTKIEIPPGSLVCIYRGDVMSTKEAIRRPDKAYLMRLGPQVYVDAREHTEVLARYINDCRNPRGYNVTFVKRPEDGIALVVSLRWIHRDEELFVDYGRMYWASLSPSRLQIPIKLVGSSYSDAIAARSSQPSQEDDITLDLSSLSPPLVHLPDPFEPSSSFHHLTLARNHILQLPSSFGRCASHLQSLCLRGNALSSFPDDLCHSLTSLRSLDLSHNHIFCFPSHLSQLLSLESLDLSGNRIEEIDESTFESPDRFPQLANTTSH